jgi:hypothetical protein
MNEEPKRAAVSLDEVGDRRLSEISAADFLQVLEQAEASGQQARPEDVTVRDAVVGARAAFRLPSRGGLPEKKKVELSPAGRGTASGRPCARGHLSGHRRLIRSSSASTDRIVSV